MEIRDFANITSPFHTNLNRTLDLAAERLRQALTGVDHKTRHVSEITEKSAIEECLSQVFTLTSNVLTSLKMLYTLSDIICLATYFTQVLYLVSRTVLDYTLQFDHPTFMQ